MMPEIVSGESQRKRKRLETRDRIANAGLRLFASQGYAETTIEQIVAVAGIARRTFFHYFRSKDDILLSLQRGMGERVVAALAKQPLDSGPLSAARGALLDVIAPYSAEDMLAIDRLMRSSEAVQAKKYASYKHDEEMLSAALQQRWPGTDPMALRLIATLTVQISRIAVDLWIEEGVRRPLAEVMSEVFHTLDSLGEIGT
jgi:AcrR family transcriptional regulator